MKQLAIGAQLTLLKSAGAVLCGKHGVVSIPAGEILTITDLSPDDARIVTAKWKGEEVFVFREDLASATVINSLNKVPTQPASPPLEMDFPKAEP